MRGKTTEGWRLNLWDQIGETHITDERGASPAGQLEVVPADNEIQEDTFIAIWNGSGSLIVKGPAQSFQRQIDEDQVLEIVYRVIESDVSQAILAMGEGALDVTAALNTEAKTGWQTSRFGLSCFVEKGAQLGEISKPLIITAEGSLKLQVASVRLTPFDGETDCG
mgnify:CR=1 FL=1